MTMSRTKDEAICEISRTYILTGEMHQPWTDDLNWVIYCSSQLEDVIR